MKNIIRIIQISKPLHKLVGVLGILILLTSILNLVAPLLIKSIVDVIDSHIKTKQGDMSYLIFLIVAAFAANLVSLVLTAVTERMGDHFAGELRRFLTEKFYDKVLSLPQSYFDSELSGKLVNQLNRGIQSTQEFMNGATNFILPTFLQSILIVGILAYYNLPIALFILILFPIYLLISYHSTVKWGKEEVKKNVIEDKTRGRIQEVIVNMALVKSFTTEIKEFVTVSENLKNINKIYAGQSRSFHIYDFFRGFSLQVILFGTNLIVFYNAFIGVLSIGEMVLILQLIGQARIPLFAMSYILTQIQQAESGSKEYFELMALESTENYKKKPPKVEKIKNPHVEFKNVSFQYETSNTVLHDVNLHLKSPESVALVGHSGAGKSTLINLILKFYEPTSGELFLNDSSYKKIDHFTIRGNVALVFQDNELFSSTIAENVAYGSTNPSEADIVNALKLANAYDFVMKLPKGLDSEIGERGVRLSGGQKQRIQIARAILKDAPILILDEATSSLDAKSEKEVQTALENLMKKKLVIIIAHRFSTIQNVNKIVVIEEGRIVDTGTPKELSTRPGIYSDLLRYQIEGNKKLLEKYDLF